MWEFSPQKPLIQTKMARTKKRKTPSNTKTTRGRKTTPRKKRKKKMTWRRRWTQYSALLVGSGIITLFTPLFTIADKATGGLLHEIWEVLPLREDAFLPREGGGTHYGNTNFSKDEELALPKFEKGDRMVIRHKNYTLRYNETHEQAEWIAYRLEARETYGNNDRQDDFRPDPKVTTRSALPSDYRGSGYDRGHLAPAADFKFSKTAMSESFFMSNMSPQAPDFNRGIWRLLEEQIRRWVKKDKVLYIVTGPVLKSRLRKIGKNRVSVPKEYYKIVLDLQEPQIKVIAFLMPNKGSKAPFQRYVVSIDKIEQLTGLDFFPQLPDDVETKLERSASTQGWF